MRREYGVEAAGAIQLRHLRYFVCVMEELHFGRAARRLHMAQPPLSKAIHQLEHELGVQLLERTTRGVRPTEAGLAFANDARAVLTRFDDAIAAARRGGTGRPPRIGAVPYLDFDVLQRLLAALHERAPALTTTVSHASTEEQVGRLRASDLDLAIVALVGRERHVESEPLCPGDPLMAVAPAGHPLAAKDVVSPGDVRDENLVMFPRGHSTPLYDWWIATLEGAGYRFRGIHTAGGADARDLMTAVAGGRGIGFATSAFIESGGVGPAVAARPIDPPVRAPDLAVA